MALASDAQGVKSIRAIGAALQFILLGLGQLFAAFILAAVINAGGLYRYKQVLVVLTINHRHKVCFAGKHTIDEKVFEYLTHRHADVHLRHHPSSRAKGVDDDRGKAQVIHRIRALLGRGIVIEHNAAVTMVSVVFAEVLYQFVELPLVLDIE